MIRIIESLALMLFHFSLGAWVFVSWKTEAPPLGLAWHLLALPLGFFLADWFSGIVHWMCDRLGTPETPVWGVIAKPFRDHHDEPMKITEISLRENLGSSAIAGCIVFWISYFTLGVPANSFAGWLGFWFLLFAFLSNLFHRWSHFPKHLQPGWMQLGQRLGLLLPPTVHWTHHRKPFRVNYCILSGWANAVTNRTPWRFLERRLASLGVTICD